MDKIIYIFEKANEKFLDKEKALILSGVAERTLCGSFMKCLEDEIQNSVYNKYYVDIEYNRNKGKIKTIVNDDMQVIDINCDIIIHSRGEIIEQDNLIAIEMKKSISPLKEKNKDKERLRALTKNSFDDVWSFDGKSLPEHVCRYLLGVYYEINLRFRRVLIQYYSKGNFVKEYYINI